MSRLLIISCSERKARAKGRLPAIDRYDGPAFRVLRKYLRENGEVGLSVFILSARYGLFAADRVIPDYDLCFSKALARKLRPRVLETARRGLLTHSFKVVGICAGKVYRAALAGFEDILPDTVRVDFIEGGLGPRLRALRKWLRESA